MGCKIVIAITVINKTKFVIMNPYCKLLQHVGIYDIHWKQKVNWLRGVAY